MEELSREIVRYLRHNPTAPVNRNAYAPVEHILQHFRIDYYKLEAAIRQPSDKQRLFMSGCRQYVRAAAGHSIPIDLNLIGIPIKDPVLIGYCCHGTTVAAYEQIKREGLKTMNRQYVHFATERARLRHGSQVVITLNVKKYLQQGLKLFRLEDGNIAAPGNSAGIIKPCFFKCIVCRGFLSDLSPFSGQRKGYRKMADDLVISRMEEMNLNENCHEEGVATLFDLPWHDVIFPHVFKYLHIQTIFQLRGVCKTAQELVREYFSIAKEINIARIAGRVNKTVFETITRDNVSLLRLNLRNAKDWLTDSVLSPVLKDNTKLQEIDLTNCMSLTSITMQVIAVRCPQLQTLILRDCHWLSVEGLSTIALNSENLEKIDLTGCWNVNDESIILLVMNCRKLKSISLSKIYGLTDNALSELAKRCENLIHLNVQGCWRITDDSVRFLGEYCKNLQMLQIRECYSVTEKTLQSLRDNKVKMDVHRPPTSHNARMDQFSRRLRHRLNLQT